MAQAPSSWTGFKNAFWALAYQLIAQPLSRLGDRCWYLGLWCLNTLSELDDKTKNFKQFIHDKAWPDESQT